MCRRQPYRSERTFRARCRRRSAAGSSKAGDRAGGARCSCGPRCTLRTCGSRRSSRSRSSYSPGGSCGSADALNPLNSLRPCCSTRSTRSGRPGRSGYTDRTRCPRRSCCTRRPGRPCRPRRTGHTCCARRSSGPGGPLCARPTGIAGRALRARRPLGPSGARCARDSSGTRRPLSPGRTRRPLRSGSARCPCGTRRALWPRRACGPGCPSATSRSGRPRSPRRAGRPRCTRRPDVAHDELLRQCTKIRRIVGKLCVQQFQCIVVRIPRCRLERLIHQIQRTGVDTETREQLSRIGQRRRQLRACGTGRGRRKRIEEAFRVRAAGQRRSHEFGERRNVRRTRPGDKGMQNLPRGGLDPQNTRQDKTRGADRPRAAGRRRRRRVARYAFQRDLGIRNGSAGCGYTVDGCGRNTARPAAGTAATSGKQRRHGNWNQNG